MIVLRITSAAAIAAAREVYDPCGRGNRRVNYRTEQSAPRTDGNQSNLLNFVVHSDPTTPIVRVYLGDPVKLRLCGKPVARRSECDLSAPHAHRKQVLLLEAGHPILASVPPVAERVQGSVELLSTTLRSALAGQRWSARSRP